MPSRVEWSGDEWTSRLQDAADEAVQETAFALQGIVRTRLSRIGKFKSFGRQATDDDRAFVAREGFVDAPGGSPRLRTGALRRAIQTEKIGELQRVVGVIGALEYAGIHEFGGPMPGGQPYITVTGDDGRPTIRYIRKETAARLGNRVRYTKPYNMPARPFLRPSLNENKDSLIETFRRAIRKRLGVQ